jgi:hypothetical protein
MTGNEKFIFDDKELDFGILDFWKYKYSNVWNMQEYIAEFLIEKSLRLEKSQNTDSWTLYDINYRNKRIEIKETSYYHPWNENSKISKQRVFGITMANSSYENSSEENKFERQNDLYIFCLNIGETKEESNPMNIKNWEFYIVPTKIINNVCGNNKTINLGKVKNIAKQVDYFEIKNYIDYLIDNEEI